MHRSARVVAVAFVSMFAATFISTSRASAASPWIYRGLTLPRHDIALDFGLGYGHADAGPNDVDGFGLNLELRAGKARPEALRNLADRTGVDDLGSLVTMLIQTDKFGTSVAQALRVYSETLRTKRRQRAEEAAAKTGVKMVFPLVFCIFPAIWVVTIGPAAIKFVTVLFPLVDGTNK